jgi:subtilisin family serine protease
VGDPGAGVDVYVVDSGINHPQDQFKDADGNDRVKDFVNFLTDSDYTDIADDGGHGTLVASALGGNKYGVAKGVNLFDTKYERDGEPDVANFILAIKAIIARHRSRKTQDGFKGSVINMSLDLGQNSRVAEQNVESAYEAGITMVASAGNEGYDPLHCPAAYLHVLSIGASNINYIPYEKSGYGGDSINLWAPGEKVPLRNKDGETQSVDGTSLSAGFVSGVMGIFYGVEGTSMNPDLAKTRLMDQTDNWIDLPNNEGKTGKRSKDICQHWQSERSGTTISGGLHWRPTSYWCKV